MPDDVTVIVELPTENEEMPMSDQIKAQMETQMHNTNRRLDDVAERFHTSMGFTEARANQQWQSASAMLFAQVENDVQERDLAMAAMRKKMAENSNPSTQGGTV